MSDVLNKEAIKILLVDDDLGDRRLVELALSSSNGSKFAITSADCLSKALELLENNSFDVILLDLGLPDSSGIDTVDKVYQKNSNTPIIVLTGLSNEEVGVAAIKKGATDYVTKPFKSAGLRTRIGIALQIGELQQKLTSLANTDEMTGLVNYRHFFDILDREILRAKINGTSLAVLMIDTDHFKSINDTYGHLGGDAIIRQMGQLLKESLYPLDVAARYGGDEFIILMPNTSSEKAIQAAERLRRKTDQFQWEISKQKVSVTITIGVANIDSNNLLDSHDLIEKADTALYSAKQKGRNCVVSWDKMDSNEKDHPEPCDSHYVELQNKVASLTRQLKSHVLGTILALNKTVDIVIKDPYIAQHGDNVKTYACAIAEQMGLSAQLKERIGIAALLQDIGKIGIPEHILKKKTPLTDQERKIIQHHPISAMEILEPIGIFDLELKIIKHHHERFDGQGYPSGLKGREIPIGARILAVADTFDSLTSDHEYRSALSIDGALKKINDCSSTQFDPDIVEYFMYAIEKYKSDWPLSIQKNLVEIG